MTEQVYKEDAMAKTMTRPSLRSVQEFQAGTIRFIVTVLMLGIIGIAGTQDVFDFDWTVYLVLFAGHIIWFGALLLHVAWKPEFNRNRTYLGAVADVSGTSCTIFLIGNAVTPFFMLYIWSFLSQGTRFGKINLLVAAMAGFVGYSVVAALLGEWNERPLEIAFMLLFLAVLPMYQNSLLSKLHSAKLEAEEANKARGNFLATMTHELRTPLSGVIGMARLLNGTRLNDEQKEYLESINSSAKVLQSLIGDILDLSKIDSGKLALKPVRFDIRALLVETAAALSSQALDKGVEVVCRVSPGTPELLYGDELRMRQILFNLAGNAVKFTEQGHVCIQVEVCNPDNDVRVRHVRISVHDTGIGIAEDKLSEIFQSFWQAEAGTTRRYGGTGLGTTISRDLALMMNGAIGVESEEGVGSTFWVKVPLLDKDVLQAPVPPAVLSGRKVVVLESNPESAAAIAETCKSAGMLVQVVSRIDELGAIGAEKRGPQVDLLLVADSPKGVDMAGMARMIRNMLGGNETPVLYLHYARRKHVVTEAQALTLAKPFSSVSLWLYMAGLFDSNGVLSMGSQNAAQLAVQAPDSNKRILVAEDDNINAKLVCNLLEKAGRHPTLVRDGHAALQAARETPFDLALIDLRMPKMDGVDFTRAWRSEEPDGMRLPIIALTANAAEDAKAECLEAGMDEFLTKPVDPDMLDELLRHYGV